jgi:hypothetical protein
MLEDVDLVLGKEDSKDGWRAVALVNIPTTLDFLGV